MFDPIGIWEGDFERSKENTHTLTIYKDQSSGKLMAHYTYPSPDISKSRTIVKIGSVALENSTAIILRLYEQDDPQKKLTQFILNIEGENTMTSMLKGFKFIFHRGIPPADTNL